MAKTERKRKFRDEAKNKSKKPRKFSKKGNNERAKRNRGPRLPFLLRKELDRVNPGPKNSDDDVSSDEVNDVYEYEEQVPLVESNKNRFDQVDNYEYEMPEQFEDEDVASDDADGENEDGERNISGNLDESSDEDVEEEGDERHNRMLQEITGMPSEAFEGFKRKKNNIVVAELFPESEYNPSRDVLDGTSQITLQELLEDIPGADGSELRKRMSKMERKSLHIHAPLPKAEREKLERQVANEHLKKDVSKWLHLVTRNREAPTLYFDEDRDTGFSTVGAIASEFKPRTEFEKKMASLHYDDKIVEAHKEDGARLLELNKISVEDYKKYRENIVKMRNLLFRHEIKAKRIKKIKSKAYRRVLKKDRSKAASAAMELDPEAAKEEARKQERKRAEERMTLKHKNTSKWAKRIIERGLNQQDEGTRAAIAAQLSEHARLTRKMNSMMDAGSSGSDDSSDEDDTDENSVGSDQDSASKLLLRAREKTLKELENGDEMPKSGVHSLPFMVRGLKKREEAAIEEGRLALQEYDRSLKQLEDRDGADNSRQVLASGRRVFGVTQTGATKNVTESTDKMKLDNYYGNSDSEDELEAGASIDVGNGGKKGDSQKDVDIKSALLDEDPGMVPQDSVFKSSDDLAKEPGPKTTYEVAIFASGSWKKMKCGTEVETGPKKPPKEVEKLQNSENLAGVGEESDTESGGQMVDGILSSIPKASYELPSQGELIRQAFAGDDVEEHFEKEKQAILNGENPEPEKPALLPGWGQWTDVQQRKGLPTWMVKEYENSKTKREEALRKRKDAHLKNVIISERLDKKAEKLHTKTLPFPFTSKEVFDQSMRMPIGPEFNPVTAFGALTRPDVVKKAGVKIKPIKFEEVDPYAKGEEHKGSGKKKRINKSRPVFVKS